MCVCVYVGVDVCVEEGRRYGEGNAHTPTQIHTQTHTHPRAQLIRPNKQPSMTLCQNDGWSSAAHVDSPAPDGASLVLTNDFVRRIMDTCQKDHVLQGWECQQKQTHTHLPPGLKINK